MLSLLHVDILYDMLMGRNACRYTSTRADEVEIVCLSDESRLPLQHRPGSCD